MKNLGGSFSHVIRAEHTDELQAAFQEEGINCAYAPLIISPEARAYIDTLDLSQDGEFAYIVNPDGHDPSIGEWKGLGFIYAKTSADLDPDKIERDLKNFPEREGKTDFARTLSMIGNAYWPIRQNENGMYMSLMLKYAATNPKFHLDDNVTGRGLVTLRGNAQKGATKILSNNAVNIWQRQENGYPFLNPMMFL